MKKSRHSNLNGPYCFCAQIAPQTTLELKYKKKWNEVSPQTKCNLHKKIIFWWLFAHCRVYFHFQFISWKTFSILFQPQNLKCCAPKWKTFKCVFYAVYVVRMSSSAMVFYPFWMLSLFEFSWMLFLNGEMKVARLLFFLPKNYLWIKLLLFSL